METPTKALIFEPGDFQGQCKDGDVLFSDYDAFIVAGVANAKLQSLGIDAETPEKVMLLQGAIELWADQEKTWIHRHKLLEEQNAELEAERNLAESREAKLAVRLAELERMIHELPEKERYLSAYQYELNRQKAIADHAEYERKRAINYQRAREMVLKKRIKKERELKRNLERMIQEAPEFIMRDGYWEIETKKLPP